MKKVKKRTGWNDARRAKQSAWMKENRPWDKSTGPKTEEGKAAVKYNACTHGLRSDDYRAVKKLLKIQAATVEGILAETLEFLPKER